MKKRYLPYASLFLVAACCISVSAMAQHLEIKSYSIGYRIFKMDPVGSDPRMLPPLMKDPAAYRNFINTLQYNGLYANAHSSSAAHTFFINAELYKNQPESRFWKNHTLQAGIFSTTQRKNYGATLENVRVSEDTTFYYDRYRFTQTLQFAGVNIGLNRRSKLSKRLQFVAGLHLQGGVAVVHRYQQSFDSSSFKSSAGWQTRITQLPEVKGKNFLQWQAMLPLGLEWELYKKHIYLRTDFNIGIVSYTFHPNGLRFQEAHGAGLWLLYKLH